MAQTNKSKIMETIKLTIYSFDELSEEAKETAINNYIGKDKDYFWCEAAPNLTSFVRCGGLVVKESNKLNINNN